MIVYKQSHFAFENFIEEKSGTKQELSFLNFWTIQNTARPKIVIIAATVIKIISFINLVD